MITISGLNHIHNFRFVTHNDVRRQKCEHAYADERAQSALFVTLTYYIRTHTHIQITGVHPDLSCRAVSTIEFIRDDGVDGDDDGKC